MTMSTSTDGGLTWGTPKFPGGSGVGGQPVVAAERQRRRPVRGRRRHPLVPLDRRRRHVADVGRGRERSEHGVAGNLRTSPLPSAEVAGDGKVYVAWQDCGFRSGCTSNDIVYSTSTDGVAWTAKHGCRSTRRTAASTTSSPGSRSTARHPGTARGSRSATTTTRSPSCNTSTCQLTVGFIVLDGRRRDVDERAPGGGPDQPLLDREHEPGRDGRRLHVDLLRRRQLRVPDLRGRQSHDGRQSSTSGPTARGSTSRSQPGDRPRAARPHPILEAQHGARPRATSGHEVETEAGAH